VLYAWRTSDGSRLAGKIREGEERKCSSPSACQLVLKAGYPFRARRIRRSGEIGRRHYSFIFLNQTFSFPCNRRHCQASNCPDNEKRTNTCALEKEDPCSTRD
jgi:hypothetical protein